MNDSQSTEQEAEALLASIGDALEEINRDIEETDRHASETLLHVENGVDSMTAEIKTIYSDVEEAEKQTEETLDILILNQLDDE